MADATTPGDAGEELSRLEEVRQVAERHRDIGMDVAKHALAEHELPAADRFAVFVPAFLDCRLADAFEAVGRGKIVLKSCREAGDTFEGGDQAFGVGDLVGSG